ncbi:hypothetical protein SARC_09517 [Sphaeroforma arctica JP610]|uniref:RRM domain-containing protein n=1 Tax=Sphaeroforma arctica JP610 TaxID=667725 RepID=A0A0L0FPX6_9EUKA|nr:hypothetical protein SARC_09517 [Sphaeroforma arctica JP610]KNC78033.1 hypothetical protein SARC_09517 [Sphaeroforma arctica JP610]|eukprot:XP_014151935.1 hypothetical protein SARC_09517 [Sphaeroforma arctica JP610]
MGGRMNDRMGPPLRGPPGGPGMRGPPQDRYMGRGPPGAGDMNHGRSVDPRAPAALPTPVLMVYNVPPAVNCDGIFNLFSLYGQVMKAKKLPNKEGAYMVEMLDGMAAGAVLDALQGTTWYGSEVALQPSKHLFMGGNTSTNETRTVVDYTQSEHNRFSRGNKNTKVHEPTKVVHFYNLPPELTLDQLGAIFSDNGAPMPIDQVIFNKGPEKKSSSGLVEFADVDSATQAVISAHHSQILMGERKFTVKMAFSATIAVNSKKQ